MNEKLKHRKFLAALLTGAFMFHHQPTRLSGAEVAANPADVGSIDQIVNALYHVLSGPAGKERDWDRFRTLFVPGARFISIASKSGGGKETRMTDVAEFVAKSGPGFVKGGFFEREIGRDTQQFGDLANVFSTYETRRNLNDPKPIGRGINSIQLLRDGSRWWIVNVYWQSETKEYPIPEKYLKRTATDVETCVMGEECTTWLASVRC